VIKSWDKNWRSDLWADLQKSETEWDLIVIGGGITGAGVLREASRRGLKALLVEQKDFSWGTSSRSSKMVHGGLRYLTQGDFKLTREAVVERQRMLDEAPGLVEPMKYLYPFRQGDFPNRWAFNFILRVYDFFAGRRDYQYFRKGMVEYFLPGVRDEGLYGATQYTDAVTDDSRLVMRVLQEAQGEGGVAANYLKAKDLVRENGKVVGLTVEDVSGDGKKGSESCEVRARVVVNATGAWADRLRGSLVDEKRVRPLRGSHIVVPSWRLPVHQVLAYKHPVDGRFIFIYPWEGVVVLGTTDLDHQEDMDLEAGISAEEVDYILAGANDQFPKAKLTRDDILNTFSGVRPIVGEEGVDAETLKPSAARRDHVVWSNDGMITVTGGKLTTFRAIALDVMKAAAPYLPVDSVEDDHGRVFSAVSKPLNGCRFGPAQTRRLKGFYGSAAQQLIDYAHADELSYIPGALNLWAELRWSAAREAVQHLDDLLLRRTRLGLLLPQGGMLQIQRIKAIAQPELGWDDERWNQEVARYQSIWTEKYSVPAA
jgi:glycerol-3-phosphate dehydrogenase